MSNTNTNTATKAAVNKTATKRKAPAAKAAAAKAAPQVPANVQQVASVVAAQVAAVAKAGGPGAAGKLLAKVYTSAPPALMASTLATQDCKPMPANGPSQQRFAASTVQGASLYTAAVVHGLTPADIRYWAKCGYLTIVPPTQAQVAAMVAHWQHTQGKNATT